MLKIRLQRLGRKNDPHFKLIVTPHTYKPKTHKFIEDLGYYNAKAGKYEFKAERVKYWMSVGAKVTPTVFNFLVEQKIVEGKKKNVLPRKSITKVKKELKKK
ncbi:MAG: 30S ribosomal protein S16 [Candidatus Pacebacteria bacterium]|nr:30S ribosomal protein S16 [Candidatus Paceibacterota bacterium]